MSSLFHQLLSEPPNGLPPGYSRSFTELELGTYWHLYRGTSRINGGLAEYVWQAREDSSRYARLHYYSVTGLRRNYAERWDG